MLVSNAVEIAWLRNCQLRRVALRMDLVSASSASNSVFSPDGLTLACFVTLTPINVRHNQQQNQVEGEKEVRTEE